MLRLRCTGLSSKVQLGEAISRLLTELRKQPNSSTLCKFRTNLQHVYRKHTVMVSLRNQKQPERFNGKRVNMTCSMHVSRLQLQCH